MTLLCRHASASNFDDKMHTMCMDYLHAMCMQRIKPTHIHSWMFLCMLLGVSTYTTRITNNHGAIPVRHALHILTRMNSIDCRIHNYITTISMHSFVRTNILNVHETKESPFKIMHAVIMTIMLVVFCMSCILARMQLIKYQTCSCIVIISSYGFVRASIQNTHETRDFPSNYCLVTGY